MRLAIDLGGTNIRIAQVAEGKCLKRNLWGIERSGFFNGRGKWAKDFDNQRV